MTDRRRECAALMGRPNFTYHWWMPNGVYVRKLDRGNRAFVLKTIIKEAVRYGRCVLPRKKLADLAMSDPSTIDATIKLAVDAKLMTVNGDEIHLDAGWLNYLRAFMAAHRGGPKNSFAVLNPNAATMRARNARPVYAD